MRERVLYKYFPRFPGMVVGLDGGGRERGMERWRSRREHKTWSCTFSELVVFNSQYLHFDSPSISLIFHPRCKVHWSKMIFKLSADFKNIQHLLTLQQNCKILYRWWVSNDTTDPGPAETQGNKRARKVLPEVTLTKGCKRISQGKTRQTHRKAKKVQPRALTANCTQNHQTKCVRKTPKQTKCNLRSEVALTWVSNSEDIKSGHAGKTLLRLANFRSFK